MEPPIGTDSKDLKLAGMSLTQQFDYLSLSQPPPPPHGMLEEEEEEVEEEEEEDELEEDDEEEKFGICDVCLKENEHSTFDCPYLNRISNPTKATIGSGYDIVCRGCYVLGGHPERVWVGRAVMKSCSICGEPASHWCSECPKNPNPVKYENSNNRRVVKQEFY